MSELLDKGRELLAAGMTVYVLDVPLPLFVGGGVFAAVTLLGALKWIK